MLQLNKHNLIPVHNQPPQEPFQEQQQKLDESCNGLSQELVDSAARTMHKSPFRIHGMNYQYSVDEKHKNTIQHTMNIQQLGLIC